MSENEIALVASGADFIVNGYAYTEAGDTVRVLNLNNPQSAAVLSVSGEVSETNMDDIELGIVCSYFKKTYPIAKERCA